MVSIDETCRQLQTELSSRSRRFSPDELLYRLSVVSDQLPDFILFVKQPKFFDDPGDVTQGSDFLLMNYISFQISHGHLLRFESRQQCNTAFTEASPAIRYDEINIIIACDLQTYNDNELTIKNVARVMSQFFHLHIYDGSIEAAANRFQKTLMERPELYSVDDLLQLVIRNYHVDGLSLLQCQFKNRQAIADSIRITDFGVNSSGLLVDINGSLSSEISFGRPIDGFNRCTNGACVSYTVLSASSQNWKAKLGDGEAKFVVLFSQDGGVDEFLTRFIREGLKRTSDAEHAKQLHVLKNLDQAKRELHRQVRLGVLRLQWEKIDFIKRAVTEVANLMYRATSAHSVTVRLFNPFRETLELVAECAFQSGKYKSETQKEIPTQLGSSINVQTFKEKGPNKYSYVPVIEQTEIDAENKVYNPRASVSEICFPIWQLGVPVGTLNLESPLSHAFGADILFLQSAVRLIGDLLRAATEIVPPDAVTQMAKVNENAHGSLSVTEVSSDELTRLPVTLQKIVGGFISFVRSYRSPVQEDQTDRKDMSLRNVLREAVEAEILDFRLEQLDFNRILPAHDRLVSAFEADNIKSVVSSIIRNAEKHSSLLEDYFRLFLIERGRRSFIVIRYRSDYRPISAKAAMEFGLRPFARGGRVSYGAFLLAARVRSIGGLMHVNRPEPEQTGFMPLELAIILPLGRP